MKLIINGYGSRSYKRARQFDHIQRKAYNKALRAKTVAAMIGFLAVLGCGWYYLRQRHISLSLKQLALVYVGSLVVLGLIYFIYRMRRLPSKVTL